METELRERTNVDAERLDSFSPAVVATFRPTGRTDMYATTDEAGKLAEVVGWVVDGEMLWPVVLVYEHGLFVVDPKAIRFREVVD